MKKRIYIMAGSLGMLALFSLVTPGAIPATQDSSAVTPPPAGVVIKEQPVDVRVKALLPVKWEYRIYQAQTSVDRDSAALNQLGAEGWELAGAIGNGNTQLILKRPVQQ